MSYYSDINGVIYMTFKRDVDAPPEFWTDYARVSEYDENTLGVNSSLVIYGYESNFYDDVDDFLNKYCDYIQKCEVYGEGEDGSRWRWRKENSADYIHEENALDIYEGDTLEDVAKKLGIDMPSIVINECQLNQLLEE